MKNKIYALLLLAFALTFLDSCKKTGGQTYTVITDVDGNEYKAITIGTQTWMMQNLQTTHYADSTPITNGQNYGPLGNNDTSKLYFLFNNNVANLAEYGRLYTWAAIMNSASGTNNNPSGVQGPCPNGWHVPSEAEWLTLINYLGGQTAAGGPMKGVSVWEGTNVGAGSNVSGFNALPGGQRLPIGTYNLEYSQCYFWTATDSSSAVAYMKMLSVTSAAVVDSTAPKNSGYSCRCVQNN